MRKKGTGTITKFGHVRMRKGDVFVMQHRIIWERYNGPIPENMFIHHINGNPSDNRIENLQLVDYKTHNRVHSDQIEVKGIWYKFCSACGELKRTDTEFYSRFKHKFSAYSYCKPCALKLHKAYRRRKKERSQAQFDKVLTVVRNGNASTIEEEGT